MGFDSIYIVVEIFPFQFGLDCQCHSFQCYIFCFCSISVFENVWVAVWAVFALTMS